MSATNLEQAFSADSFELRFSTFYGMKDFVKDAGRLRDLYKLHGRERLSVAERAELAELRKRLKRVDADTAMLVFLDSRSHGGINLL